MLRPAPYPALAGRRAPRRLLLSIALATAMLGVASPAVGQRRTIRLTVGQSETVSPRGTITKVQVLNPRIADVATYSTRGATVVGVGAGTTELLITTSRRTYKYTVIVTKVEIGRVFKQVRKFLGRIEGIYPRMVGDTVVLSGVALTADDYGRAQRAVKLFGNKVRNLVRFKPSVVQQVNRIFDSSGLTDVNARLVGGTLFLEGSVGSPEEMEKVKAILRSYGLNVENLVKVGGGKQILIDVQFVEMRKSNLDRIGVKWPVSYGVSDLTGNVQGQIPISPSKQPTITANLTAPVKTGGLSLEALFSSGSARLLAQPKLVCGSGKSAEFIVGGEVPIVVITNQVVNINYKEFGIKLKVKPTADSLGNVRASIFAEVSEPDRSIAVQNIPGFRTRKFKTFVTIKDGASLVLSGLFTNSEQKSVSKLPLLGHIPILGELFKSREFRDQKTTLVVFVTPKVVSPQHSWVRNAIKDIQRLYKEYEAEVGWQVFD